MKTKSRLFSLFGLVTIIGTCLMVSARGAVSTNKPGGEVTRSASKMARDTTVYSIRFPGGKASDFFNFLRTNGFAEDTVLFAGRAGEVVVPPFTVKNVRLKEVAKSIEMLTEGQVTVELVEAGEA